MASKITKNDGAVTVRLSKAQIQVIAPGLLQMVSSYQERVKYGTYRFSYPFHIYPPNKDFDRGTEPESVSLSPIHP